LPPDDNSAAIPKLGWRPFLLQTAAGSAQQNGTKHFYPKKCLTNQVDSFWHWLCKRKKQFNTRSKQRPNRPAGPHLKGNHDEDRSDCR
jgi:hypothetical protein